MNYRYKVIGAFFITGILTALLSIFLDIEQLRIGILLGVILVAIGLLLFTYWNRRKNRYRILKRSSNTKGEECYIIQQEDHFGEYQNVNQDEHVTQEQAERMLAVIMGDIQEYSEEVVSDKP